MNSNNTTTINKGNSFPLQKKTINLYIVDENAIIEAQEKRYHCDWDGCQKSYKKQSTLEIHIRKHVAEKIEKKKAKEEEIEENEKRKQKAGGKIEVEKYEKEVERYEEGVEECEEVEEEYEEEEYKEVEEEYEEEEYKEEEEEEERYHCNWDGCKKSYKKKSTLELHTRRHTDENQESIKEKELEIKIKLEKEKREGGEDRHYCKWDGCGKSYKNKSTLMIHSRKHADGSGGRERERGKKGKEKEKVEKRGKKYICQWNGCQKFYKNIQALKLHIHKHASEKKYRCWWKGCKEQFDKKKNWNAHHQSHTGDSLFLCEPSNLVSLANYRLKESFSCSYCPRLFNTESDLLEHKQKCLDGIASSLNNRHGVEPNNSSSSIVHDDHHHQTDHESKNNPFHQNNDNSPLVLDVVTYALLLPHYPSLLNCDYKIQNVIKTKGLFNYGVYTF
ncbi:hypothetical protein BJ944DRAFT_39111 [Cunninghamella echinulata]|nr:hypothetical protein BJ944DRAFT_39111 [Cunninghamella echinulata]